MKTKRTLFYGMIVALAVLFGGCTEYPDDYGFMADMHDTELAEEDCRPDGYDVTLRTPVSYDEGTGITKYGYIVNGSEAACEFVRSDGATGYLTLKLSNMEYGTSYDIVPFMGDDDYVGYGKSITVSRQKEAGTPQSTDEWTLMINTERELVLTAHYISAMKGYPPVTTATARIGAQKEVPATVSDDGTVVTVRIPFIGDLAAGDYSGITVTTTNDWGTSAYKWNYSATVSNVTGSYTGDGNKGDCIRLCGIDWAKGNFVVTDGTGKIQANQWVVEPKKSSKYNNGAYFNAANNHRSITKSEVTVNSNYYAELKGNKTYDAVTAYLDGWGTPSNSDYQMLIDKASVQLCNVVLANGTRVKGILLMSPQNRHRKIISTTDFVDVSYLDVDDIGLFLPVCGFFYWDSYHYNSSSNGYDDDDDTYFSYQTSTVCCWDLSSGGSASYWTLRSSFFYLFYPASYKVWNEIFTIFEEETGYRYNPIRPVKLN